VYAVDSSEFQSISSNSCVMWTWYYPVFIPFLFLLQPTNAQLYITKVSVYRIYTPIYFDISVSSSGSFTFVPCWVT